jgi:NADH-quinone oxidoreductase subunit G/NADP-reducing hydrogenase subunit HndD
MINIEVNNTTIQAKKGETILQALIRNGIKVPTLCNMNDFSPTGACRMCVVEVEGKDRLVPSCAYPVEEWMKIKTHSPRVIKARKTVLELLLANHPDDCLYCDKNGRCELQHLSEELHIKERRFPSKKHKYRLDQSSTSIVRDPAKCILCGRCVRVCEEIQGVSAIDFTGRGNQTVIETTLGKGLNLSSCVHCGQCVLVCPTGALHEREHLDEINHALHDPETRKIVQFDPSITVSLAENFGLKPGKDLQGTLVGILRKIGFETVFDASFGADLASMETTSEFIGRMENGGPFPLITSSCPSWVKYAEQFYPGILPNLSTVKSPQQIVGALIKSYLSDIEGISLEKIYSVSVQPCTAKKFEGHREEMLQKGISDIDTVLTTRELLKLIKINGMDPHSIEEEMADQLLSTRSSAGKLSGVSGGTTESFIRNLHYQLTNKELDDLKISNLRNIKGTYRATFTIGQKEIKVAIVSGLQNAANILEEGDDGLDFIEIMACPGGCIAGGGQPSGQDEKAIKNRQKSIYALDEKEMIRAPYKNPAIIDIYEKFLEKPGSSKAKKLLHTKYSPREIMR